MFRFGPKSIIIVNCSFGQLLQITAINKSCIQLATGEIAQLVKSAASKSHCVILKEGKALEFGLIQ